MFSGSRAFITSSEKTLLPKSWRIDAAGRGARRPLIGHDVMALMADSRAREGCMAFLPNARSMRFTRGVKTKRASSIREKRTKAAIGFAVARAHRLERHEPVALRTEKYSEINSRLPGLIPRR